jgi:hypothetical protein
MSVLDGVVDVSVTANTASLSRAGFGTPGLIAYFPTSLFSERSRLYSSLSGMISDGFLSDDAAYLMAVAIKAQNPSPKTWKVLRKALPSDQLIRVTPTITTEGEVLRLTVNGTEIAYTIQAGDDAEAIATALTALFAEIVGVTAADDTGSVELTPKNVASCTVTVTTEANAKVFTISIDGEDYSYTSDADATKTEIRDGLQALILADYEAAECVDNSTDALDFAFISHAGADVRVSYTGGLLTISAGVSAYRLLSVGGASAGLDLKDETADPGIATDWAAILAEDSDFYGVGLDSQSEAEINALAALIETERMLFVTGNIDSDKLAAGTTTDVGSDLQAAAYDRTSVIHASYNSQYAGCRWLGKMLAKDPGSATWAYKTLAGLTISTLTAAELAGLQGKNVNCYISLGGANVTFGGPADSPGGGLSAGGEYLDITRGVDWFQVRLQERFYRLLVTLDKIPYADAGALAYAEIFAQLRAGQQAGLIAPDTEDTPWVISIPDVADIAVADKALRSFPGIEFSAYLAGAVHTFQIMGTLSL